ncbi:MAG: glycosyltransferase family 4 protein [Candidatus Poribacteria bacterium]|nr:glycosyltransferase family 4 protein [Candidatus Poribacteria bacterium]
MRILYLSVTVPFPPTDGGRIRVLNLLKQIAKKNQVTFLSLETTPTDDEGIEYLRRLGIDAHLVPLGPSLPPLDLRTVARSFFKRKPITVARYDLPAFGRKFHSLLQNNTFDLIHYAMFHAAQYHVNTHPPTLLSQHNVDSRIWQRLCEQTANPLRRFIFWTQKRAFERYERVMSSRFDAVAVVSEIDRALLREHCPDLTIGVVPNGVDIELYQPNPALEEEATLIYTGSMDWQPNEDAVLYFAEEIFPRVQANHPDLRFYVVGKSPTPRVQKLAQRPGFIVTGGVEDIKPYIARAAVYVVPLRIGGGTRLKILEALAMEKAVVSTSVGEEGLNLVHGEEIMIADEPVHFADIVSRLITDKQMRQRIGRRGRRRVEADYDWKQIGGKLQRLYEGITKRQGKTRM